MIRPVSIHKPTIATTKKPVAQDWHRADIIAAVWKRGTTLNGLSLQHGYQPGSLNQVLRRPWPKGERLIAECIGVPARRIWPSRYHADGSPRSGRGERGLGRYRSKGTSAQRAVNVHVRRAA
jgi:Ner family transcriptional regulator